MATLGIRRVIPGRDVTAMGALADREFLVPNMVCEGCAQKVAGALTSIPGVREITSNVATKRIRVRFEPGTVQEHQLKDALTKIGFTALDAPENT